MKKIYLLLSMAFLLCFNGIAQKNQKGIAPHQAKKKSTERNYAKFVKHNNAPVLQIHSTRQLSGYFLESFEGTFPPAGWSKQDPDGGTGWAQVANGTTPLNGWQGGTQTVPINGGGNAAYCTWKTGGSASNDQWLITPQFNVSTSDSVTFDLWWFGAYEDSLFVLLSTNTNATSDFTTTLLQVDTTSLSPMSTWKHYSFSLSAYAGQNVYVAFREKISDNQTMGAYFALDLVSMGTQPLNDVASQSIDVTSIIAPGSVSPMATVANVGALTQTFNVTMNITGGYTSTKTVTALVSGNTQQVTFDNWTAALGIDTITVFTQLANDTNRSNDTISKIISVQNLTKAYCYVASDPTSTLPQGPAVTSLEVPSTITSLADQSGQNFVEGGTWGLGNKWYGSVNTDNTLITIDTVTGARTVIGNLGVEMTGLTYDYSTHKLFGVSWDGTSSSLYSISPSTGAAILIGNSTTDLLINLACDTSGNLYSVGITNDFLYTLNKYNGTATSVGAIGFDASYAQDMEFDHYTNTCYLAGYDNATSAGELSFVNILTGAATVIGTFENGSEITGFAIPYNAPIPSIDAGASAYSSPANACGLANENVTITIDNLGSSSISGFPVSYTLNGGVPVTETFTGTITAGASQSYTFAQKANLSTPGAYIIKAYPSLTGDAFPGNDTLTFTVQNIATSVPPYSMGFETNEDLTGWKIEDANSDGYTWTIATTGGNTGAYCAEYSYNSNDIAVAADDWLITKCIDLQASTNYNISYYYMVASATYPESFDINIGTSPVSTALTTQIISNPSLTNTTYTQGNSIFTVPATGTYYIGFHCNSAANEWNLFIDDINIVVGATLSVTASASPDTVCPGHSSTITALPNGGSGTYTYTWSNGAGTASTTVSPTTTTTYFVTVSDGANTATNSVTVTVKSCAGITDYETNNSIRIYPNPTTGLISIAVNGLKNNAELTIYSLEGQSIYSTQISGNTITKLDMSYLPKGIYFVKVTNDQTNLVSKLIIQ